VGADARGVTKGISIWLSRSGALSSFDERKWRVGADAGFAKSEISQPARETSVRSTRIPTGVTSISIVAECLASEW